MKRNILFGVMALVAGSLLAADSSPKEDVIAAAKQLGEKASYTWKSTTVVPEGTQFRPGPTEGKTEKDGFTYVTSSFGDNTTEMAFKGDKAAVTNRDGDWQGLSELDEGEGAGRFQVRMLKNFKKPAVVAADLVATTKELKKEGDAYVGELTEEGAKAQFRFGNVSNPKASVKFWIKDGVLAKYEVKSKGKVSFNDNEFDSERTTTTEIKEIGTTKVNVPEGAKKKLS